MGGPAMPAVGWAAGIERLAMLAGAPSARARPIVVIPVGEAAQMPALELAQQLRREGWPVDLGYSGNLKKRLDRANKLNARLALIIGDTELQHEIVIVRDLDAGTQAEVAQAALVTHLDACR